MTTPEPGSRTAALLERVELLEQAVGRGGSRVPSAVLDQVTARLAAVRGRLDLGVDHTVVALVGGTGSGKSSLFNALAGLHLADVGVRRPTTSEVTACLWAHDATALLDWLGVAPDRRVRRESALDGQTQADLRGLVLLDLPDLDSVRQEHRDVVDRLLPQADLLIWVLDPQKYADDAIHTGYLRHLVGHEASMVVAFNQVDTLPPGAAPGVLRDVGRLLREDGLADVPVHAVSAQRGDGISVLRTALVRAVSARSLAETRATAEIQDAARLLASGVGGDEPHLEPLRAEAVRGLAAVVGLPDAVRAVDAAASRRRGDGDVPGAHLVPAAPERVDGVRARWLAGAGQGLPPQWRDAIEDAVPDAEPLARAVDARVGAVPLPSPPGRGPAVARALAFVLGVLALVGAAVVAWLGLGDGWTGIALAWAVGAAVAGLLALVSAQVAGALRRASARRAAGALSDAVTSALEGAVQQELARPTADVLADHRAVRLACLTATATATATATPSATADASTTVTTDVSRAPGPTAAGRAPGSTA